MKRDSLVFSAVGNQRQWSASTGTAKPVDSPSMWGSLNNQRKSISSRRIVYPSGKMTHAEHSNWPPSQSLVHDRANVRQVFLIFVAREAVGAHNRVEFRLSLGDEIRAERRTCKQEANEGSV